MDFCMANSLILCSPITELDIAVFHISYGRHKSFIQVIHFHVNEDDDKLTYSSTHSLAPKELRSLRGFFLGQKDKGKIILFGGFSDSLISEGYNARQQACRNTCVLDGTLSVDGTYIIWKATDHALPDMKLGGHIMFYLNNHIYIVEELITNRSITCHKYSLKDKQYHENVFRFPERWYEFPKGNLASIDKNSKFSLIVAKNPKAWSYKKGKDNDNDRKLLFFTEKEGFQKICRFQSKERHIRNLRNKNTEQTQTKISTTFSTLAIFAPHTIS